MKIKKEVLQRKDSLVVKAFPSNYLIVNQTATNHFLEFFSKEWGKISDFLKQPKEVKS